MNEQISDDAIILAKGANDKIREWYLKNRDNNKNLFTPFLGENQLSIPYVEMNKEEVMKL